MTEQKTLIEITNHKLNGSTSQGHIWKSNLVTRCKVEDRKNKINTSKTELKINERLFHDKLLEKFKIIN